MNLCFKQQLFGMCLQKVVFVVALSTLCFNAVAKNTIGIPYEWGRLGTVIVHTPQKELFFGIIHPAAGLYESAFNIDAAAAEHKKYVALLENMGANVQQITDLLMKGTIDAQGKILPGKPLNALRRLAKESLKYDPAGLDSKTADAQITYRTEIINMLHPTDLVRIILLRPTVILSNTQTNSGYAAQYQVDPLMNLFFLRDQMITTAKGLILGRMNTLQRKHEIEVVELALMNADYDFIYRIAEPGRLEGGDYLAAGKVSFIGMGLRTNAAAINQLLSNNVIGSEYVAVIKDRWKNLQQMHLDTYFNVVDSDLVMMSEDRLHAKKINKVLLADVYKLSSNGHYKRIKQDMNFIELLHDLGFKIIAISEQDQINYGVNILTVGPREIIAVQGLSKDFAKTMVKHGVKVHWIDFTNMKKAYGAAHCTTQVISRHRVRSQ